MTIAPGWYAVPGTADVRWWDGNSFREVTLVDGAPRYRFGWGLPAGNYLLAAVATVILGVVGLFTDDAGLGVPLLSIVCAAVTVVWVVISVLAMQTVRLAPPSTPPIVTAEVQPLPGTIEPGLVAAGWYAGPQKDKPRWWTGKQWSDYVLAAGQPFPTSGQAARVKRGLRRALCVSLAIVVVCIAVGVAAAMLGNMAVVPLVGAVGLIALVSGIGCRLSEHRAMKPFIRPMLPPTGERLA